VSHPTKVEFVRLAAQNDLRVESILNWGFPAYSALKYLTNISPGAAMNAFGRTRYSLWKRLVCRFLYAATSLSLSDSPVGCQLIAEFRKSGDGDRSSAA